jgi:hypothetical protein
MTISTLVIVSLEIFFIIFFHRNAMISSQPTPTSQPSRLPSSQPTRQPYSLPSSQPSRQPSSQPSGQPSSRPSYASGIPNLYLQLVAGTSNRGFSGDNGPATSSQISARVPWVDSSGNLYIPDGDNAKIRKVNSVTRTITTFGGTSSSPNGNGGPIGSVAFFAPYSIVGDTAGTFLYISDEMFVWKYEFSNDLVSLVTFDVGFSGDGGPATVAQVNGPKGLCLTTDGDLYIADSNNHRIRLIRSGNISTIVGSGCSNACSGSYSGDDGPATAATLYNPTGVYVDLSNGKIFIADSSNNRIRVVNNNNIITTFAGTGSTTDPFNGDNILATTANLKNPQDVKGDSLGNIYIADFDNQIIRMINTNRVISTLFGTLGMSGFSSGTIQRSSNSVIYFSDRNSIHRSYLVPMISANLFLKAIAGSNTAGFQGDSGQATSARLQPQIPFVDTNGKLYIPDDTNSRIRAVDPTNGIISTFGGLGSLSTAGASAPIASVLFNTPYAIVGDKGGSFLYVSDQRYVWKYVFTTNIISVYAHSTTLPSGFTGDEGPANLAQLTYPKGLWLTTAGDLYIADTGNNRIRKVTAATGFITTVAGAAGGFSGDTGPATSAALNTPTGVYMDSVGFLYIADTNNFRIRVVDSNKFITTFAGSGIITPFNGNNIPATSSNLKSPLDVKGDSLGNIYLVDSGFFVIRMVDIAGIITTLFGNPGSSGFSSGIYPRSGQLNVPRGIWVDTLANIYFSDATKVHRSVEVSFPTSQPSGQPLSAPTSQPSRQPSGQPSRQPVGSPSGQPTRNPFSRPTSQPSRLPTGQPSKHPSSQPSRQPTSQPMGKPSSQPSLQPSTHPTTSPTIQPTCPSGMPTTQPSSARPTTSPITSQPTTPPITSQPTSLPVTFQPTPLPSSLPSVDPSRQPIGRPTSLPSAQPTRNPLSRPTGQPSRLPTSQPSEQPLGKPSSQPSQQPYKPPTAQPSSNPTTQPSVVPSRQPTSQPTAQPTGQPTRMPSTQPSSRPTRQPSSQPTSRPSKQPTAQPTLQPFVRPTFFPSSQPSRQPNSLPTVIPTRRPSGNPSIQPTTQPSTQPSTIPSHQPSNQPTSIPTDIPKPVGKPITSPPTNQQPSNKPSGQPSSKPTSTPVSPPTSRPTRQPIGNPPLPGLLSSFPSSQPSNRPSDRPSIQPSSYPSAQPTSFPFHAPTFTPPTLEPTGYPTTVRQPLSSVPTAYPSVSPSSSPSMHPSAQPSNLPSVRPSNYPTNNPFSIPSSSPSLRPNAQPSSFPSVKPSRDPSSQPSSRPFSSPSSLPTKQPASRPSSRPSSQPSKQPTSKPSRQPISHPSSQPTRVPSSSFPSSIPTIVTEKPTPLRAPSISAYPSQTSKPTKQPFTRKPTAVPTVRPSFFPTPLPTQTIAVFPSGNSHFKASLFFFGPFIPVVESNIPNLYLTEENNIGSSYIIFGFRKEETSKRREIIIGNRNSQGLYSSIIHEAGLVRDQAMSRSALPLGDFNGDSQEDLIICDPINSYCFVYFGQGNGFVNLQVSFAIKSANDDLFGWSIAKLNDLNEDNNIDMAISALSSNIIYIFFGSPNIADIRIVDQQLTDSSLGIKIVGSENDQNSGLALSSAGDLNNDGFSDILFSAIQISPYQNVIYVLFLSSELMKQNILMDNLTPNKDYLKILAPLFCFAGFSLSNLGDVNQDGFDDIIIGSIPYSGKYLTQKSYVIYGRKSFSTSQLLLTEMMEEEDSGFTITGGGFMVAGPGDVNGDGIPDMMISNYQQWQGKGNSYIMVYPRNVTSRPTFLPSSQPSSFPSSSPTSLPSFRVHDPTSTPTFQQTTNEPMSEGTFPPFLEATQFPSIAPKTSKPTRVPSRKSTTYFPTMKTDLPSVAPSRNPTVIPTIRPTTSANTKKPSRSPITGRPITSRFGATSVPTATVSELSLSTTPPEEITIDRAGVYQGPSGNVNYIISGEGSIKIVNNNNISGGKKLYTILPSKNSITITNFNKRTDQIGLMHFPALYSINDLVYRTNPLQIFLSNKQKLILPSLEASELTEDNFIFHSDDNKDDQNNRNSVPLNFSSMISLGLLVSCAGLFGFLVKMNQRDGDDEESTYSRKDTLIQVPKAVVEVDIKSENVVSLESSNEKLPSEESSSEEGEDGGNDSENSSKEEEQSKLSENDWDLFSALNSFFSSDSDSPDAVQTLEGKLESVFNVFDVVDPEEQEVQSFVFTESDDEQETNERDNIDIEGN